MNCDAAIELLPDIYGCAESREAWRPVLDRIREKLGVKNAVVQLLRRDNLSLSEVWCERDSVSLEHAELHDALINNADNPRFDLSLMVPPRDIVRTDDDVFPVGCPQLEDFRRRLASVGMRGAASLHLELGPSRSFSMVLHRAVGDERQVDEADKRFLREIAPHVQRTLGISERLRAAELETLAVRGAADCLRLGMVVCEPGGELRWANRTAEGILQRSPALSLVGGRLRTRQAADRDALRNLLGGGGIPLGLTTIGRGDDGAVHVMRVPSFSLPGFVPREGDPQLAGLVLLESGAAWPISPDAISRLLDLSPTEGLLVASLCAGATISEYAQARGVSEGTARIQLKRALAKAGCHRQADLVRRVCLSLAGQVVTDFPACAEPARRPWAELPQTS